MQIWIYKLKCTQCGHTLIDEFEWTTCPVCSHEMIIIDKYPGGR